MAQQAKYRVKPSLRVLFVGWESYLTQEGRVEQQEINGLGSLKNNYERSKQNSLAK